MIDVVAFIKFLMRYKWIVIGTSLFCTVSTFFLVKNLPDQYKSQAQLSTGISDRSQEILSSSGTDYFRVSQQFGNLMELMKTKRVINMLSLHLMIHDLGNTSEAFRPLPDDLAILTPEQREEVLLWYQQRLSDGASISPLDNKEYKYFDYLIMMGYDAKAISEKLAISRNGESDYINVDYLSENPELSAYAVNTFSREFIHYYHTINTVSQQNTMVLLDSMLREKERAMNEKNAQLRNYKSSSGVVNLGAQADVLFSQISAAETKRSQTLSDIQSLRGAISQINAKLSNENDVDLNSNISEDNNALVRLGRELDLANQQYINNNFSPEAKRTVDSLENVRSAIIARMSSRQLNNPQANRQTLIQERTNLEISLSRAENSMASVDADLANLRSKFYSMAPTDASVQNLEREADLAVKEYTEAMNRFNQASIENVGGLRLRVVQVGLPSLPEPSKKLLYTAGSGIASLSICLAALLVVFLLDNRVLTAKQLTEKTGHHVIGSLSLIDGKDKDFRNIWGDNDHSNASFDIYKDLVRALRFEINNRFSKEGAKVLGITSVNSGEGKTFVSSSLAYAFALMGKKVLLIGDDCKDLASLISNNKKEMKTDAFEKFLVKKEIKAEDLITVLSRNPNNTSIMELRDSNNLIAAFDVLRETFDIIIIDVNSLRDINRAKEWLMFTDRSIGVFKWGDPFREEDREFFDYMDKQEGFMGWVINQVKVDSSNVSNVLARA